VEQSGDEVVSTLQNKVTGCKWTKFLNSFQKVFLAAPGHQVCQKIHAFLFNYKLFFLYWEIPLIQQE